MNMRPRNAAVAIILVGIMPALAHAQLYRSVAKGLSLLDFQFAGERNLLGNGWTINEAAFWNNRRFDFGLADLTLTGAMRGSAGYTLRGIPAVNFSLNSGGSPLSYQFNMNNGIQDLSATGSVLIDINTHINALGFYDQTFQISNRGQFATDGFGLVDSGTLDYDAGPINISGNIFADALAAVTEPFFAASGTDNPFAKFSGRATKAAELNKTADELRARVKAGELLSDDEIATLVNNSVLAAMLGGQPTDHLFDDILLPRQLLSLSEDTQTASSMAMPVPEPAALGLMLIATGLLRPRRTDRR